MWRENSGRCWTASQDGSCRMLRKWENLPEFMKCDEVREYYDILSHRKFSLLFKRAFDLSAAAFLLVMLFLPMLVIAVLVKLDSFGPVFYRQERVTAYGRVFRIHKFRTMEDHADRNGPSVTVDNDVRVTGVGAVLRRYRLDELPQLIDVLRGNMSFVGTRPEIPKYVKKYTKEMYATLLLPAGITSEASVRYKDEARLLENAEDADRVYVDEILPRKMEYNLKALREMRFYREIRTMVRTLFAVLRR